MNLREQLLAEFATNDCEPDARDIELVEQAVTSSELIARLEAIVEAEGETTHGSRGQPVVHPLVSEIRQHKLVLTRILKAIDFGQEEKLTPSQQARAAARSRWGSRPAPNNVRRVLPEAR